MTPPANQIIEGTEVLVVEDSRTQALFLKKMLEYRGCRVMTAANGREAVASLATRVPALVISDIQMPVMDGYELCRHIKSNPETHHVPVILLTSLSSPSDIVHGLECGADNFVVKPYEEAFLIERVGSVLANGALDGTADNQGSIAIEFSGQHYSINASRRQILNLLLSTYETAVKANADLIVAHDALKAAQAQLIEAEKMESVGRLAAGIAHEVRNPLAIMEMGLEYFSGKGNVGDDQEILGEMREAVKRANGVIVGLMDMASPRELGMNEISLHDIIDQALKALQLPLARAKIRVTRSFAEGLPLARVNADKMEQVFVNVFTNAIQAMPKGGFLVITTKVNVLKASDVKFSPGDRSGVHFREGDQVIVVEVSDIGEGIPPEHVNKVFDPFFSTKPTGKGMGLGLTVARKIVGSHHGAIEVRNNSHQGVTVTIKLKAASPSLTADPIQ